MFMWGRSGSAKMVNGIVQGSKKCTNCKSVRGRGRSIRVRLKEWDYLFDAQL